MFLRHISLNYLEKEDAIDIDDLYDAIKSSEDYRAEKVKDLQREWSLVTERIRELKVQKTAYLRKVGVTPEGDDPIKIAPVNYMNPMDTEYAALASNLEINQKTMLRNPSSPLLNYTRLNFTASVSEIAVRLRDFDYQLLKLSQQEQRIVYYIDQIKSLETTAQDTPQTEAK